MKTFGDLTYQERVEAVDRAKDILVGHVLEGVIELEMPNSIVQLHLEKILSDGRKSENMKLAKDMLIGHVTINRILDKMSIAIAEGSRYDLNSNFIM